jgi:hypothetical protein
LNTPDKFDAVGEQVNMMLVVAARMLAFSDDADDFVQRFHGSVSLGKSQDEAKRQSASA